MQRFILGVAFLLVIGLIAALLAVALGVFPGDSDENTEVSAEAASAAEEKLARVSQGEEVALTSTELTSLFRYRPEVWSLDPIDSPVVEMQGDTIRLNGRVAKEAIPPQVEMGPLRSLLPDTTRVLVAGTVRSLGAGEIVLQIGAVEVEGMPIPSRYYAQILQSDVLTLPLPTGISAARVEAGELILTP